MELDYTVRIVLFSGMLLAAAWQDLRRKTVDVWIFWCGAATAALLMPWAGGNDRMTLAAGGIPGALLLLCGKLTGGGIGSGDGWFFLVGGWLLGFWNIMLLFCGAVFLCGIWALGYFFRRQVKLGVSVRKETLPFLPFVVPVWLGLLAAGWISG